MSKLGLWKLLWLSLILTLAVSLVLTGCTQETPAPSSPVGAVPAPATTSVAEPVTPPAATQAADTKSIELRLSHHDTPVSDVQVIFEEMAKRVEAATNGRIKIIIYPSETLAKSKDAHDAVASGLADIAWCMTGVSPGRYPLMDIFNIPALGFYDAEMASLCANELGKKYSAELSKELSADVVMLDFATTGVDVIGTRTKPIRTVADFRGMKLRVPGANNNAHMQAMGAVPVMMAPGDIYTNVEKGVIDGWNMPWAGVTNFKLGEITKYYTESRSWVGPLFTLMNRDKYNSLPEDLRNQMMSVLNEDWVIWQARLRDQANLDAKKKGLEAGGEDIEFSAEEKIKMQQAAKPVWDEYIAGVEAKGLPGKAFLADILKFVEEYQPANK